MALRYFLFLLAAYIVFHKIFPFGLFRARLADMTGADFLLLIFRSPIATAGAAYFAIRGFIQPALQDRDRIWCERWAGLAFGVITIRCWIDIDNDAGRKEYHHSDGLLGRQLHSVAAVLALGFLRALRSFFGFALFDSSHFENRPVRRDVIARG